jgi:hypothetical protein
MASLSESLVVTATCLAELEAEVASLRAENASLKARIKRARQALAELVKPAKTDGAPA